MNSRNRSILLLLCVASAAAGLVLFPQPISQSVSNGLFICLNTLLPTLFPFMILSGFFVKSGLADTIGQKAQWIMGPLFGLPGTCFPALFLGMIGGYPTGAKTAVSLYQNDSCSRQDAEHILAFCNNCGPGFFLGPIGFGMFGNIKYGFLMLAIHVAAAVLTGIFFAPSVDQGQHRIDAQYKPTPPLLGAFVDSVADAMSAFLSLCSFVLCFSAITAMVITCGVPNFFSAILPFSGDNSSSLLLGALEMTTGILNLNSGPLKERFILISALAGWGGLSVHCQVMSLLQDTDLSPGLYWRGKALHAILSSMLTAAVVTGSLVFLFGTLLLPVIIRCIPKKSSGNRQESVL